MEIRNVAIIAHVDHGKTTLVDALLRGSNTFDAHAEVQERVMDSDDQEKERGITIYAKNTAIEYKGTKINIIDTPGHADFGSEVERMLRTVDATLLVVDAYEGPMPQTKFVLQKSLQLGLKVMLVINKIDKPSARCEEVVDEVFDLFAQLGATDEQLDFPVIYAVARDGVAVMDYKDEQKDITPMLDWILSEVPAVDQKLDEEFAFQPATLSYDSFLGRIAVGRVHSGKVKKGQTLTIMTPEGEKRKGKISKVFSFKGLERIEVEEGIGGDVIAIAGIADIFVGETVTSDENMEPLPAITVDPPALSMDFMTNDSPLAGREGKYVTSRNIKERLERELETNVGLSVEFPADGEAIKVYGRGEMHLAVLIENMRREGFELQVSQPEVVIREIDGVKMVNNHINTYGINLVSLKFDSSGLTKEDKLKAKLYYGLITSSSTEDYSYTDISNNLTKYFFAFNLSNNTNIIENTTLSRRFTVNFEYLQDDSKEVYKTLDNLFFKNKFDNKLEIKNRLNLYRDALINTMSDSGAVNKAASLKSLAMVNPYYNYILEDQLSFDLIPIINKILNNYDEEFPKLQKDMKEIQGKLFNKSNLVVFYANEGNYDNFKKDLLPLLDKIKATPITPTNYAKSEKEKLAIIAPVQNGTTAWGNNLKYLGYDYSGKYKVMSNMINEYLNNVIRIQNGAYGAWFSLTLNDDMIASTYRDGEIDKTLETYENIPKFLESAKDMPQDVFDGFKLKSMTKYYQSYTPDQLLALSYTRYLYNINMEKLEKEKAEVLATTKDDIPEFIEIMNKFVENKNYNTINSQNIIKEKATKYKFDKTIKFEELK